MIFKTCLKASPLRFFLAVAMIISVLLVSSPLSAKNNRISKIGELRQKALNEYAKATEIQSRRLQIQNQQDQVRDQLTWLEMRGPQILANQAERDRKEYEDYPEQIDQLEDSIQAGLKIFDDREQELVGKRWDVYQQAQQREFGLLNERSRLQASSPDMGDLPNRQQAAQEALDLAREEKALVIAELKNGLFCSQCSRSKYELEKPGKETFEYHLRRVNGHPVARPELIKKKADDYDKKIANRQQKVQELDNQVARRQVQYQERLEQQLDKDLTRNQETYETQKAELDKRVAMVKKKYQARQQLGAKEHEHLQKRQQKELQRLEKEHQNQSDDFDEQRDRLSERVDNLDQDQYDLQRAAIQHRNAALRADNQARVLESIGYAGIRQTQRKNKAAARKAVFNTQYQRHLGELRHSHVDRSGLSRLEHQAQRRYRHSLAESEPFHDFEEASQQLVDEVLTDLQDLRDEFQQKKKVLSGVSQLSKTNPDQAEKVSTLQAEIEREEAEQAKVIREDFKVRRTELQEIRAVQSQIETMEKERRALADGANAVIPGSRSATRDRLKEESKEWLEDEWSASDEEQAEPLDVVDPTTWQAIQKLGSDAQDRVVRKLEIISDLALETGKYWAEKKVSHLKSVPSKALMNHLTNGGGGSLSRDISTGIEKGLKVTPKDIAVDVRGTFVNLMYDLGEEIMVKAAESKSVVPMDDADRMFERTKAGTQLALGTLNLKRHGDGLIKSYNEVMAVFTGYAEELGAE